MNREKAVALTYDDFSGAPRVVAKGEGELAKKIIEFASREGIPVHQDPDLIEALIRVELTREIPPQLYQAIAEVLAIIYQLDKRSKQVIPTRNDL